jgi:hypothetical protein
VEILDLEPEAEGRFRCRWFAAGSVGHFGHVHWRRNRYEALLTLTSVEGHWRLAGLEFIDEARIDGSDGQNRAP